MDAERALYRSPSIDAAVLELFALVSDGFSGAKEAFLHEDHEIVRRLIQRERTIDARYLALEREVNARLLAPDRTPEAVHYLVTIVRIIPELERSGDLTEHIARKGALGLVRALGPRARGLLESMAELALEMWQATAVAFELADPSVARRVNELDEALDDLHVAFSTEIASTCSSISTAMDLALVARFVERFGDHAVNLARSSATLTTLTTPMPKRELQSPADPER